MTFRTAEYQLSLEWTLAVCAQTTTANGPLLVHVADLDATLTIHYWPEQDQAEYGWEAASACIDGYLVTPKSDPVMWAMVERAVRSDRDAMNERIQERACEYAEAA